VNKLHILVTLFILLAVQSVPAQQPRTDFSYEIEQRREVMQSMARNASRIQYMVYGMQPYKAADAKLAAGDLVRLSNKAYGFYPPGSVGNGSRARDELWEHMETFREYAVSSKQSIADLAVAAEKENLDDLRATLAKVYPACERCHIAFRRE